VTDEQFKTWAVDFFDRIEMIHSWREAATEAIKMIEEERAKSKKMLEHLELALSFAPKGDVTEGLAPMFYHTLSYNDEIILQRRINEAREVLIKFKGDGK